MKANPAKVAQRFASRAKAGGILQAPPALVNRVSKWVVSSVATTKLVGLRQEHDELEKNIANRRALISKVRGIRAAVRGGMKVRALYSLVFSDPGNIFNESKLLGHNTRKSATGWDSLYEVKFKFFSAQYKKGNLWLERMLSEVEQFIEGEDPWTVQSRERNTRKMSEFEGYLSRGGGKPIPKAGLRKTFSISRNMRGWRYKDLFEDPGRMARSKVLQLQAQMKQVRKDTRRAIRGADWGDEMSKEDIISATQTLTMYRDKILDGLRDQIDEIERGGAEPAFSEVQVLLNPGKNSQAKASWDNTTQTVTIYFPHLWGSLRISSIMGDLKSSVRHELQHMTQTLLRESLGVESAGNPRKEQTTPLYKQWMKRPESFFSDRPLYKKQREKAMEELRQQGAIDPIIRNQRIRTRPQSIEFHALDDIEFFTRLQDSVREAKNAMRGLSGEVLDNAIDIWTGDIKKPGREELEALGGWAALRSIDQDSFFETLQKVPSARKKYMRAVREFRKELGYKR
jgi:hypothetical protein